MVLSVQPSTVSVRVFCRPTTCRARGNDVSAMNILTRKSGSEYVAIVRRKSIQISSPDVIYHDIEQFPAPYVAALYRSSICVQFVGHK